MLNRVSIFVCVLVFNLIGNISHCHGDDYNLSIDMNASFVKTNLSLYKPPEAPFSTGEFKNFSVGVDIQRPHFAKPSGQENTRNARFTHTLGIQRRIAGDFAVGIYSSPITRGHNTPFGDAPSQITDQTLQTGGFEFAYLF